MIVDQDIFNHLVEIAKLSTCHRSKCGSIIIGVDSTIDVIGEGYNSMPCNVQTECFKDSLPSNFKSDKTCCIHAEQRAIIDALSSRWSDQIVGGTLLFIRLGDNNKPKPSGQPYCTICSKMALDVGLKYFGLWHEDGWKFYNTKEYNKLNFKYENK